jgi:hypothetical protein
VLFPTELTFKTQIFWIEQFCYQVVVVLTKISIVLLYLRIIPRDVSRTFTYVSWSVIGALVAYGLAFIIYFALECQPVSHFWNSWDGEHEGQCSNFQLAAYINGGANIFFDLVVFALPIPKLLKLQVRDKRRKFGAILTFTIGIFVTVCSVIRLQYLATVGKYTNATYHYNDVGIWTGLEAYLGVICACMPSIVGPVLYFFRNTVLSKFTSSSNFTTSSSSAPRQRPNYRVTFTDEKGVERLSSRATERDEEVELENHVPKRDGAEETNGTTMYDSPSEAASRELVYYNTLGEGSKGHHVV